MSDMFPDAPKEYRFTGEELAHEIHREIGMRRDVYPRRVADRKMSQADADKKIAMACAVLKIIQAHALGKTFTEAAP